jgi:hypothetical protein
MNAKKQFSYMRSVVLPGAVLCLAAGVLAIRANAANYYLDVNGPTTQPGASGVTAGSTYNWDDPIWTTTSAGNIATVNYVNGNFPRFAAGTDATGAYTMNLATDISCVGMFLEDGAANSTLTLQGPGTIAVDGGAPQGFIVRGSTNLKIFNQIVDGTVTDGTGTHTAPGGVSFSSSGGTGSGSLFLYSPTGNTYTGGTILATSGGCNILNDNSLSTGPISWTTNTTVIADPDATAPITINNTLLGKTSALNPTTTTNVSFVVAGAQPITFTAPFPISPGPGTTTAVTQTFQVGNSTFPNSVMEIAGRITADNGMPLIKTGAGTLILSHADNQYGNGLGSDTRVRAGTLVIADPTAIPATFLVVDNSAANTTPAIARYKPGLPAAAQMFQVTSGTTDGPNTGQIDVTDNSLIFNTFNNTPGAMTLAQAQALIKSGYNAGAWNGPGINSSSAANDPNHATALGVADNTILQKSQFKNVTPGTNDILVKFTYYGDADLDGRTTLDDFTLFLGGYQNGGNTWLRGDFNYDDAVTLDDFNLFLKGYQQQGAPLSAIEAMINSVPMSDAERQAMLASVQAIPEPTSLALLGVAGMGLLGRRRGRRA